MKSSEAKIRLLIVDDNPQVRSELSCALALDEHLEITGQAASGMEAVLAAAQLKPDVVLMDLEMPDMDGYEATRLIKTRRLAGAVVILSVHAYPSARERAFAAGADAFIVKGTALREMLNAIESVSFQGAKK